VEEKIKILFQKLTRGDLDLTWPSKDGNFKELNKNSLKLRKLVFKLAEQGHPAAIDFLQTNFGLHIFSKEEVLKWQKNFTHLT